MAAEPTDDDDSGSFEFDYDMRARPERVPDALQRLGQHVLWGIEGRDGRATKPPFQPRAPDDYAQSNDATTWADFETAVGAWTACEDRGLGIVLTERDPFVALDIDWKPDGPVASTGGLTTADLPEWVPDLDRLAGGYMDLSPSNAGLRVILQDVDVPAWWTDVGGDGAGQREIAAIESGMYATVTGRPLDGYADLRETSQAAFEKWLKGAYRALGDGGEPWGASTDAGGDADESGDADGESGLRVYDILSRSDYPEGERRSHPEHGSTTGANFMVDAGGETWRCWRHDCTGNALHLVGIERGVIDCGDWSSDGLGADTWREIYDAAREAGYDLPDPEPPGADGPDRPADPQPPPTADDADRDDGMNVSLVPAEVAAWSGLGEDDDISDLTDRQKAASVWELLAYTDEVHVRVRRDNGSLWVYDGGIWKPDGERALRHAGRRALGAMNYGQNVLAELKAQANSDPRVEVEPDEFGLEPGTVAVENGVVDLDAAANGAGDDALRDLEPEEYALTRLPVEYDPDAEYDEWATLVDEWAEDGRADALQEYVGYCLHIGALLIHRALLLVGKGNNGKGTFLHVVRALLGDENTTSIELQTLANEADAVADFYGSLANIDDDLSARKLGQGLGMFKKLVGGDPVRARRLYEDGFEFTPGGKHLYAANEVPEVDVPDDDEAFWRRWLLVEFPNHYPIGSDGRNETLRDDLTEPDVLSGVLNWAINGWARLLGQGHFTNEERYADAKRERWQAWGESVDKFISECVERDPDAPRLSTQAAHRRYAAWCRETGEDPVGQRQLTNKLKSEGVGYKRLRIDGTVERGYAALGLSDDVPELEDTPERADPGDARQDSLF